MEESLQEREDILAARETEFAHTKGNVYLVVFLAVMTVLSSYPYIRSDLP